MRSLLFLLLVFLSTLANINGYDMRRDPGSDIELYWQRDTSDQRMEDDIQRLAK